MPDPIAISRTAIGEGDQFGAIRASKRVCSPVQGQPLTAALYGAPARERQQQSLANRPQDQIFCRLMNSKKELTRRDIPRARLMAMEARKRFNALAMTFDGRDWEALAAFAEQRAESRRSTGKTKKSGGVPGKYKDRPDGEHLIAFLRREYRDGGYLGTHFSLADLRRFDPDCAKAIALYENRSGSLPPDVTLPKRGYRRRPEA